VDHQEKQIDLQNMHL